jgi:hypothetical protein
MKNQYFGDINDYRKYGLLRILQSTGNGRLLVAWMLTPDGGSRDGGSAPTCRTRTPAGSATSGTVAPDLSTAQLDDVSSRPVRSMLQSSQSSRKQGAQ